MELNWKELLSSKKGNFYLITSRERDIDIFAGRISHNEDKVFAKIIRGERCGTSESLNQEFGAALQFPYYSVADNWSGFDDCINDLGFNLPSINQGTYVYNLLITNFNKVLSNTPRDLNIFLDILKDTISNLAKEKRNNIPNRAPIMLNILLHCEPENEKKCKEILEKEGIQQVLRILKSFDDIK